MHPVQTHLRVAAVQMKFASDPAVHLAHMEALLASAARKKADAVLFPECSTTGYNRDFSLLSPSAVRATLEHVGKLARQFQTNVLIGSPVFRRGQWQNCLVVFNRAGQVVHCYAKCHLTDHDRTYFAEGDSIALFNLDGIPCTAIICHERRYPEMVRLGVMAGARIIFHPNAGLDALAVSRKKRGGRDGISVRAFENAVFYVFANSVGAQGNDLWSAGDSKIVAPDCRTLALANNRDAGVISANLDLRLASAKYATESLSSPRFLSAEWTRLVQAVKARAELNNSLD